MRARPPNHGGRTRDGADAVRLPHKFAFSRSARPATHGGLTLAAPGADCSFVHRTSRNSAGGRKCANKSRGRKPPVIAAPERHRVRRVLGAGRSHPCGVVAAITEQHWRPPAHAMAYAGTPATVSPRIAESPLPMRFPTHGGLTPATLVYVRLYIGKVAIPPAGTRARARAGGVSPPWFHKRNCTDVRQPPAAVSGDFAEAFLQVRFPSHGGLTPAALDAARSRDCSRFATSLACALSTHGGLTPAALDVVRPPARVAFSCQCGSRLTAGSRPPLFFDARLCIAKIVFSPPDVAGVVQERGA